MATDRGPEAGTQPHLDGGYNVVMPPEKYIPLSVSDILDAFRGNVRHEERSAFLQVCQLIEGCATTEFASLRRRVKKNYRFFSAAALHRDVPTRKGRGSASLHPRRLCVPFGLQRSVRHPSFESCFGLKIIFLCTSVMNSR
jgi:hypothetical protein